MARRREKPPGDQPAHEELVRLADQLDLTTLAAKWTDLLAGIEERAPSYTDFALSLMRVEANARELRQRQRALRRSRLGVCEGLNGFDWSLRSELRQSVVKELLRCEWVRQKRPLALVGKQGTGKTRIAKALGAAAVDEGFSVLYVEHMADMLAELRSARVDGTLRRLFQRLAKVDLMIWDEFGYQDMDSAASNDLFRLVAARHQKASTVVISNTGFKHWHRFFPSQAQAVATVDRLIDDATILRFSGPSVRKPKDVHGGRLEDEDDE
ncbi:MAG: ATP-binding protein [Burkholderiales bacterium]